jgi:hypothetical protein
MAISVLIFLFFIFNNPSKVKELISGEHDLPWLIAGFVIVSVLAVLPMLAGGIQFTTFRGNGADAVNYMTMAGYLDREPYSWKNTASIDELIEKDRSYPLAVNLLGSRWTTSALLAFTSREANLPIYQFEYPYTLLFFIMAFGPSYIFGKRLRLGQYFGFAVALVICNGFWAQFVLDTRAFSEINSIPLILSMGVFLIEGLDQKRIQLYKEPVLLGIFFISLVFSYIEIVPLCILSIILFLIILLLKRELSRNLLAPLSIILIVVLLGSLPLYSMLSRFIDHQLNYASNIANDWHEYFYPWLYNKPLIGFWGLTPLTFFSYIPTSFVLGQLIEALLTIVGIVLFAIILLSVFWIFRSKAEDIPLIFVVSFVDAAFAEFLFLYTKGQFWAAGKSLAFGYPFFILLVTGIGLGTNWLSISRFINQSFKLAVTLWILVQLCLGLARIYIAASGIEFVNYTGNHGEYRAQDYDLSPINNVLKNEPRAIIWLAIPDVWLSEHVNLAFGQNYHVIDTQGVTDHEGQLMGYQEMSNLPDYILTERSSLRSNKNWKENIVAGNLDFVLLKVRQPRSIFLLIRNPNGIEKWNGEVGFWIGGGKTVIDILSTDDTQIVLAAEFIPGPSVPDQNYRKLAISDPMGNTQVLTVYKGTHEFFFTVRRGKNQITLNDLDIPTIAKLPNGDTRQLLLGVTNIDIESVK